MPGPRERRGRLRLPIQTCSLPWGEVRSGQVREGQGREGEREGEGRAGRGKGQGRSDQGRAGLHMVG